MRDAICRRRFSTLLACCVSVALMGVGAALYAQNFLSPAAPQDALSAQNSPTLVELPQIQESSDDINARLAELTPEEQVAVKLYAERNKSVVNVSTFETRQTFFARQVSEGCGSGVVLNRQGVILTNFHVVENTSKIIVTLFNGE